MSGLSCVLWWLVLGALLGVLASWLLGRLFRRQMPPPTERIVEVQKLVDRPVDRIVEKVVEKPVDRIVEKIVEKPVDRVVEKIVERHVDSPDTLTRLAALTATAALVPALRSQLATAQSQPPRVVEKIVEKPVDRIVEKIVEKPVDRIVEKIVDRPVDRIVEKLMPDTAGLAERDARLQALQARIDELEAAGRTQALELAALREPALDVEAARQAGFTVKGWDDLEIVEGIGPKIAALLHERGIVTFAQLADTSPLRIREILDAAGPHYRIAEPGTWPEQADLAARNRWAALRRLQDELDAGVRVGTPRLRAANDTMRPAAGGPEAVPAGSPRPLGTSLGDTPSTLAALSTPAAAPAIDLAAARAAGFNLTGADNLEVVEGIGPKIAGLLKAAGISTFAQLAETSPAAIQPILDRAGPHFRMADPATWPEQAGLAARNEWQALKTLQDALNAGKR